ncbi:hypothetical protein QYM36_001345 [Artemia franciscana]|uniref:USP domain-containing protein n=1 Tax=Artemia franciscana TaxID=6661 RepID=A0AA88I639_ARTSF|nr:hypothetical protein QYM36_001345 [Artemia franciscana]
MSEENVRNSSSVEDNTNTSGFVLPLRNFKNSDSVSCYANSIYNLLITSDIFRNSLMAGSFSNSLELELQKMCYAYSNCNKDSDTSVTSKHLLTKKIQIRMFGEQRQQDASEFLICLVNALPETSNMRSLFDFNVETKISCVTCNELKSDKKTHSGILLINIPQKRTTSLNECITEHFQQENLFDSICSSCNTQGSLQKTEVIENNNDYLILSLNRYSFDRQSNSVVKIDTRLYKINERSVEIGDTSYTVVGSVSHIGASANSGHYDYIRRCTMHKWILYDDQMRKRITIDPEKYSQNVYLLLLKKKSSMTHINPENIQKQLNRLNETVREKKRQEDRAEKEKKRQDIEFR